MAYVAQPNPGAMAPNGYYQQQPPPYPPPGGQYTAYPAPGQQPPYGQQQYAYGPPPSQDPVTGYVSHVGAPADGGEAQQKAGQMVWTDTSVRNAFVRKVYFLVLCMLAVMIGITCLFLFVPAIKSYVRESLWMYWLSWFVGFGTLVILCCFEDARRKSPTNLILLSIFTLAEAFMVGTLCAWYDSDEVLIALGITAGIVLSVTIFACQTKFDFTSWVVYLWAFTWALLFFGFFAILFSDRVVNIIYASLGAFLFSGYLLVDTQMLVGGKRYELSPDEYVFGALTIFLDIINIFVMILSLVGASNN